MWLLVNHTKPTNEQNNLQDNTVNGAMSISVIRVVIALIHLFEFKEERLLEGWSTKCFYEDVISNIFTRFCLSLCGKVCSLFWLNLKLFKVSILNSLIFFWSDVLLLCTKIIFHEITANKHQNGNKTESKTKKQQKRNILPRSTSTILEQG